MKNSNFKIICAGSAVIDSIGYSKNQISTGDDVSGTIKTSVGGVAFNVCKQLALSGYTNVELLTALGDDTKGRRILDFVANWELLQIIFTFVMTRNRQLFSNRRYTWT